MLADPGGRQTHIKLSYPTANVLVDVTEILNRDSSFVQHSSLSFCVDERRPTFTAIELALEP